MPGMCLPGGIRYVEPVHMLAESLQLENAGSQINHLAKSLEDHEPTSEVKDDVSDAKVKAHCVM